MGRRLIDLTGKRFGQWVVERRGENDPYHNPRWWCRCGGCGHSYLVAGYSLRRGDSHCCRSCAKVGVRTRRIDLVGKRFGRWLVLEESHVEVRPSGQKLLFWWCRCDCGTQQAVRASNLLAGKSRGCSWCRCGRRPREVAVNES